MDGYGEAGPRDRPGLPHPSPTQAPPDVVDRLWFRARPGEAVRDRPQRRWIGGWPPGSAVSRQARQRSISSGGLA
ncbi:hypothetical protein GCM10010393_31360 [Streptomyces gobitricini]|uniref:Uncharacterized protein n=1 Tax=Streptomyces gobitricini TaxID=68211 RepID=A0ABP5ZDJ0_9ACTN